MTPRQINYNESLESYYHYLMDYLDQKYDHHSVPPAYMSEYKQAELAYYEAQARHLAAEYEAQRKALDNIIVGHVDR